MEAEEVVTFPHLRLINMQTSFRQKGLFIWVAFHFVLIFSIPAFLGTASLAWLTV